MPLQVKRIFGIPIEFNTTIHGNHYLVTVYTFVNQLLFGPGRPVLMIFLQLRYMRIG